jgi:hypothetical protein
VHYEYPDVFNKNRGQVFVLDTQPFCSIGSISWIGSILGSFAPRRLRLRLRLRKKGVGSKQQEGQVKGERLEARGKMAQNQGHQKKWRN